MGIIARMLSAGEMKVLKKQKLRASQQFQTPDACSGIIGSNKIRVSLNQEKIVEPTAKKLKSALGFPRMFIYLSSSDDDQTCPKSVF